MTNEEIRDTFGAGVTLRSGIWYSKPRVELWCVSAEGPRGGAPKKVQVLLSLDQAETLYGQVGDAIAALREATP